MKPTTSNHTELTLPLRKDLSKRIPLNNSETNARIANMIHEIEVVTNEKVEHIAAEGSDAVERFKHEVGVIKQNIEKDFAKKEKAVELNRKVFHSKILQQARIKILTACDKQINDISTEVKKKVKQNVMENFIRYVEPLLVQAAFRLVEKELYLKIRKPDENNVLNILRKVEKKVHNEIRLRIRIKINDTYLADNDVGRITVYNSKKNTFVDTSLIKKVDDVAKIVLHPLFALVLNVKGRHQENFDLQMNPLCQVSVYITPETIWKGEKIKSPALLQ